MPGPDGDIGEPGVKGDRGDPGKKLSLKQSLFIRPHMINQTQIILWLSGLANKDSAISCVQISVVNLSKSTFMKHHWNHEPKIYVTTGNLDALSDQFVLVRDSSTSCANDLTHATRPKDHRHSAWIPNPKPTGQQSNGVNV